MAILQALLLAVSRRLGQLVNTLFGWATQLLFGKVSRNQQVYISVMAFGSVAWLISVVGIVFPAVGTFLLAFIPLPEWIEKNWVRLVMLAIAALLPLIVGVIGVKILDDEDKPKTGGDKAKAVLRGYPYTAGLAMTLVLMTLFAPFMMLPLLAKRWTTVHMPLIVEAADYHAVLAELERALAENGWKTVRQPASWMVRVPTKILTTLAGNMVERFVAEELTTLEARSSAAAFQVTLHPADLVISGGQYQVARVRAVIAEHLAFSAAHQTWTKEANELEERVTLLWQQFQARAISAETVREELKGIAATRNRLDMEFEEWEVLERQQLLVERALLDASPSSQSSTPTAAPTAAMPTAAAQPQQRGTVETSGQRDRLVGAALFSGLMALGAFLPWQPTRQQTAKTNEGEKVREAP